uniref:non-specific serine/threonine protein kinase n=1 Tax=Blastobotrys adeninivorans TaxID=409370 RepID=A0A060T7D3_BLAAD
MSTWKLTKKLKEAHISSAFGQKSSTAASSGSSSPKDAPSSSGSSVNNISLNLPSVGTGRAHPSADDTPRGTVTSPSSSSLASNNGNSNALSNVPDLGPQSIQKRQTSTLTQPPSSSSGSQQSSTTNSTQSATQSTSSVKPGLLHVEIDGAGGLSLPPSIAQLAPPTSTSGGTGAGAGANSLAASLLMQNEGSISPRKSASPTKRTTVAPVAGSGNGNQKRPMVYLVIEYDKTQVILDASAGTVDNPVWDKSADFDVSRADSLTMQIYTRVPISSPSTAAALESYSESLNSPFSSSVVSSSPQKQGSKRTRRYEDIFLGSLKLPVSAAYKTKVCDGWQQLSSGSGRIKLRVSYTPNENKHLTIEDFDLLKVVGKGSFGKVMQVRKHDTQRIYALKTIRKAHIISRSEVNHTLAERTVLAQINNPFIVPLKFSFQSPEKLYLVLAFVNGGELFHHLQREGRFDLNRARFYTAELLCALECLHEYNVIYRDLKPENILLDYTGHIALCDFGLCKLNMKDQDKTNTFCGTPEYLAPELLLGQGYTKVVDWWTLGVLFYEMLTGLPPFYDQDTNEMYRKILQEPLRFPDDMDREARSLLQGLLTRDPKKRLGVNEAAEIKSHPFFAQIDWKRLMNKKYAAPFKPPVESAFDTSNFDAEFTSEEPTDSVVDKDFYLSESVQQQFGGWTYTNNDSKLATSGKW